MKTKIIILIALLGVLFTACDLNEKPYGFYSEENFYKSTDDAEAAMMYAYNTLTFIEFARGIFYIGEIASDICDVKPDEGYGSQQINNWTADGTNESLSMFFKYCFIGINRSNAVIDNVVNSNFNQNTKNRLLGEAYFLRAYYYHYLAKVFGVVPIQKNMVKTVAQTTPPMAKDLDEVYDLIISDLKMSESLLTVNQRVGRADKVAAQSLLARVYLTIASAKESNVIKYRDMTKDVEEMYDSAAVYAHKVLYDQTNYKLDNDLLHIFNSENSNGSEHIFIMSMDRTGQSEGNFSKIGMMFAPWIDGKALFLKNPDGTFSRHTPGWDVYRTNSAFYNSYDATDKRKTDLIITTVYDTLGNVAGKVGGKFLYPFTRKYLDPKFIDQKSSAKPYLIRFSEIALTYAEAVGPTSDGYYWVNEIRKRAGLGDLATGLSKENFRAAIIQERGWEFSYEGQRLYDLRRKGWVTKLEPKAYESGITEDEASFYPLPQIEVDLNTTN